ncbi:hypothetical protein B0H17DRAFT_1193364 [Mycena rosella]|uniref:Uncharacterized protein n=1 Tax=Mycena rosella TaxID=1033263 RepID=A0AAD7GTG7_MYCRO|nr:hypothetical protein B0H17DRAFT_1193364 [Mycena rosella]
MNPAALHFPLDLAARDAQAEWWNGLCLSVWPPGEVDMPSRGRRNATPPRPKDYILGTRLYSELACARAEAESAAKLEVAKSCQVDHAEVKVKDSRCSIATALQFKQRGSAFSDLSNIGPACHARPATVAPPVVSSSSRKATRPTLPPAPPPAPTAPSLFANLPGFDLRPRRRGPVPTDGRFDVPTFRPSLGKLPLFRLCPLSKARRAASCKVEEEGKWETVFVEVEEVVPSKVKEVVSEAEQGGGGLFREIWNFFSWWILYCNTALDAEALSFFSPLLPPTFFTPSLRSPRDPLLHLLPAPLSRPRAPPCPPSACAIRARPSLSPCPSSPLDPSTSHIELMDTRYPSSSPPHTRRPPDSFRLFRDRDSDDFASRLHPTVFTKRVPSDLPLTMPTPPLLLGPRYFLILPTTSIPATPHRLLLRCFASLPPALVPTCTRAHIHPEAPEPPDSRPSSARPCPLLPTLYQYHDCITKTIAPRPLYL